MNYGSLPLYRRGSNIFLPVPSLVDPQRRRSENRLTVDAATPLLSISQYRRQPPINTQPLCNWKIILLTTIFVCGVLIGIRLLLVEYEVISPNFPYYLVELRTWYLREPNGTTYATRLSLPVKNVIITQTSSDQCTTIRSCSLLITDMITDDPFDIPYNFMISTAGESYEIRGWNYESGGFTESLFRNESIVIAFIGNYTVNQLSNSQLAEIEAFISEAIRRRQLRSDFNILGVQNDSFELYRALKVKKEWAGVMLY